MQPKLERSLRGLVAQLADADSEDVESILCVLAPPERSAVEDLLRLQRGEEGAKPAAAPRSLNVEGLSGGFAERIKHADGAGPKGDWQMTPVASEALLTVFRTLSPPQGSVRAALSVHGRPRRGGPLAWLGRF